MMTWNHSVSGLLLTGSLIFCTGCAETSLLRSPGQLLPSAFRTKTSATPARILCLWEAAEGQSHDGKPTRGFAGQILMFAHGEASPVAVDGQVRIYQYDDFNPDELDPVPIHVFNFDSDGWNAHRTAGTLGKSYNVFLPYMGGHSDSAECGLQVEFIPEEGHSVTSAMAEITLERKQSRSKTQPALKRQIIDKPELPTTGTPTPPREDLNSLTIPLPRR